MTDANKESAEKSVVPVTENCINWHEIPVTDIARAREFYGTVFEWIFAVPPADENKPVSELSYSMFGTKGATVATMSGGLNKVDPKDHIKPDPNVKSQVAVRFIIAVNNIDETIEKIEKSGGKIFKPKYDIGHGFGFSAAFLDSEGNDLGLWSKDPNAKECNPA